MLLLHTVRWPGGGHEATLGVLDQATGKPFGEDLSPRIVVASQEGPPLASKARRVALGPGFTALLLPPTRSEAERASLSQAIQTFAAARSPNERIALYRHGATVQLFANFQEDRTELAQALDRYKAGTDDPAPLASAAAIAEVVGDLRGVAGGGPDVMRSLVVLAKDAPAVASASTDVLVMGATADSAGLSAAASTIDAARQEGFYKVSVCGPETKVGITFRVTQMEAALGGTFQATLPEEAGATCDVAAIDASKRVFTPRIELVFDASQRAAHEARIQATKAPVIDEAVAKSDFATGIRLAPGQTPLLARAHLHGVSSLRCDRKSYVVQLDGPARHLLPDSATDEFTLISMCDDEAYVYAPTAYALFSPDLFSIQRRFVELVIDGKTRGIYILLEKPREELVRDRARVMGVLRRDYPSTNADEFEVEWASTDDPALPLARYRAFIGSLTGLAGDALVVALRKQLDLDQYLGYLAAQSILQSGDYIDELFFVGTQQADGKGGTHEAYRVMAWDPEGFSNCHDGGTLAYVDVNQLAYCAEAQLDKRLLADPVVYKLFVAKLEGGLAGPLRRERVVTELDRTRAALQAQLTVPAVCAAMTELQDIDPGAADCKVARELVAERATDILSAYDARRALLTARIATYKAKP